MFHGFKEPTMLTGIEADADSHWNSDKESPTGNPNGRFPFGSEELPTMLQKHLILIILNSTVFHPSFNFSPIGLLSSFQAIAMALGPFLCMHQMVHCSSPPDRWHTVKQRGLPLAWSSLKFYPFTPCKTYRISLLKPLQNVRLGLQKISRYLPKGRKKMAELHVCKVKRIFITYFW